MPEGRLNRDDFYVQTLVPVRNKMDVAIVWNCWNGSLVSGSQSHILELLEVGRE
jgi:hypothetical protein